MLDRLLNGVNSDITWLKERTIFLVKSGSHCYGTNIETSDEDFRGIAIPPEEYFHGFVKNFEQFVKNDPDLTIFDIRKFFKLASDANPNMLELLFVEPSDILHITSLGERLLSKRDAFISRACKERYLGYARSQLHRIKLHRRWLFDPVTVFPTRKDFGLPEELTISKEQLLAVNSQMRKKVDEWKPDFEPFSDAQKIYLQNKVATVLSEMNITSDNEWMCAARTLGYSENFILMLQKEKEFQGRVDDWKHYQDWKKNRNPVRAAMEAQSGFDLKHAMHLIRLLRMAKEILSSGKVIVRRPDAEELLTIRNGAWTYEQLIEHAEQIEKEIKELYSVSPLPAQPDRNALSSLCRGLVEESFR